jgi:hypothetical protein
MATSTTARDPDSEWPSRLGLRCGRMPALTRDAANLGKVLGYITSSS